MSTRAMQCVIHPGQMVRLKPLDGAVLTVKSGRLWVTQTGDPHDYFLDTGQQLRLRHTRTVLEAENGPPVLWTLEAPKRLLSGIRMGAAKPRAVLIFGE